MSLQAVEFWEHRWLGNTSFWEYTTERHRIRSSHRKGKSSSNSSYSQGCARINTLIPAGRGLCTHTGVYVPPLRSCWPEITSLFCPFSSLNLEQIPPRLSSSITGGGYWREAELETRRDSNKGGIIWVKFTFSFPAPPLQGHQAHFSHNAVILVIQSSLSPHTSKTK